MTDSDCDADSDPDGAVLFYPLPNAFRTWSRMSEGVTHFPMVSGAGLILVWTGLALTYRRYISWMRRKAEAYYSRSRKTIVPLLLAETLIPRDWTSVSANRTYSFYSPDGVCLRPSPLCRRARQGGHSNERVTSDTPALSRGNRLQLSSEWGTAIQNRPVQSAAKRFRIPDPRFEI
jgi:hypothetical protein